MLRAEKHICVCLIACMKVCICMCVCREGDYEV